MIREEDGRAPAAGKAVMLCKWAEGSFLIFTRPANESLVRPSARARGLDLSSRVRFERESAGRSAAQRVRSMVNEKSVSHDNRVQRSDNTYIIVGAFLLGGGGGRKRAKADSPVHRNDDGI